MSRHLRLLHVDEEFPELDLRGSTLRYSASGPASTKVPLQSAAEPSSQRVESAFSGAPLQRTSSVKVVGDAQPKLSGWRRTTASPTASPHLGPSPCPAMLRRGRARCRTGSQAPMTSAISLLAPAGFALHSRSARKTSGTTIVASDSITNIGVVSVSLSQVIFSFGVAPEYEP